MVIRFDVSLYEPGARWRISYDADKVCATDPDIFKFMKGVEPKFCPFCATPVPKMRKKSEPVEGIMTCTDGGYYCDTCKERLMGCYCLPMEAAWEPIL